MLIGIKYCGGCNPGYERRTLVERAIRDYPEAEFQPYDPEKTFDLVLVVCGCMEECFTFTGSNSVHGVVSVRAEKEYQRFRDAVERLGLH